jgi:hypothetical protein
MRKRGMGAPLGAETWFRRDDFVDSFSLDRTGTNSLPTDYYRRG